MKFQVRHVKLMYRVLLVVYFQSIIDCFNCSVITSRPLLFIFKQVTRHISGMSSAKKFAAGTKVQKRFWIQNRDKEKRPLIGTVESCKPFLASDDAKVEENSTAWMYLVKFTNPYSSCGQDAEDTGFYQLLSEEEVEGNQASKLLSPVTQPGDCSDADVRKPKAKEVSSTAAIKSFWEKLHSLKEEDEDQACVKLIDKSSKDLWKSEDPTHRGYFLTDFICQLEEDGGVLDLLIYVIDQGAPVTADCFKHEMDHMDECCNMLKILLNSGKVPEDIDGVKLLDACCGALENDEIDPEEWQDFFEEFVIKLGKDEEGVTYAADGPFKEWLEDEEQQEWLAQKRKPKRSRTSK